MTKVINMTARGTLTLPKGMRQRLGLKVGCQVVAEETARGILIRACVTLPVETATDRRRVKFENADLPTLFAQEETLSVVLYANSRFAYASLSKLPIPIHWPLTLGVGFLSCNVVTKVRTQPIHQNAVIQHRIDQASNQHANQSAGVIDGSGKAELVAQDDPSDSSQKGQEANGQLTHPKLPKTKTKPEKAVPHHLAPLISR